MTRQSKAAISRQAEQPALALHAYLAGENPAPSNRVRVMGDKLRELVQREGGA